MEHQVASAVGFGMGPGLKGLRFAWLLDERERLPGVKLPLSRLARPANQSAHEN
jgi:hypothetical protein